MFKHIYMNSLKVFVREKELLFWLLLFPMILGILFKMAFSEIMSGESFEIIPVSVSCSEEAENIFDIYRQIFEQIDMLDVIYTDEEGSDKLLTDGIVAAALSVEIKDNIPTLSMSVMESSISQSIVKEIADKINESVYLVMSGQADEAEIYSIMNAEDVLNNVQLSGEEQDTVASFFYTILGMTAMYGSLIGLRLVQMIQANQSSTAMRFSLAPVSKMRGFLAVFAAGATIHATNMVMVYLYLRYILDINFGSRQGYIILVSVVGGITGVSFGTMICTVVKAGAGIKNGICMAFSMIGSFLAGMMSAEVKYSVMKNAPLVEYVNPVGLVTDAYLKLFYYEDLGYFWSNIINLIVITAACLTAAILTLRRQRYDYI